MISADRREMPVLGYSEDGDFDVDDLENIPPELKSWIIMMEEEINSIREGNSLVATDPQETALEWNDIMLAVEAIQSSPNGRTAALCPKGARCDEDDNPSPPPPVVVGPFLTTTWGQGCGYNDSAPIASGGPCGRALAGCVATAMAQVMRFHQHPTRYNWGAMPADIDGEREAPELARLMRDAGDAVGMDWGAGSSGAQTDKVDNALRGSFGYSSATWRNDRNYNHTEIKNNLKYRRPVILRGKRDKNCVLGIFCDYDGGHAWVCDGYRTYNTACCGYLRFHMNWGWDGAFNGWFAYNNWNPGSRAYNYKRGAVVNIRP